jgi:hypothetical protein
VAGDIFVNGAGIEKCQEMELMTTSSGSNPNDEIFVVDTDEETGTGTPETLDEAREKRVNEVANKAAHKAARDEQEFDKENSNLFTK